MLQGEHSAILSTCIKLPFSINTFFFSFSDGFTVISYAYKNLNFWSVSIYKPTFCMQAAKALESLHICALTCDFQQCGIFTSVDSGEPVLPPVKLRNSKCCSVSSLTLIEYSSDKQRL